MDYVSMNKESSIQAKDEPAIQMWQPGTSQPVIFFGEHPILVTCRKCHQRVTTKVTLDDGTETCIAATCAAILCSLCCILIVIVAAAAASGGGGGGGGSGGDCGGDCGGGGAGCGGPCICYGGSCGGGDCSCERVHHSCPVCGERLGTYHRK